MLFAFWIIVCRKLYVMKTLKYRLLKMEKEKEK